MTVIWMSSLYCEDEEMGAALLLPTGLTQSSGAPARSSPLAALSTATASPGRTGRGESSGTATRRVTGPRYLSPSSRESSWRFWRDGHPRGTSCWVSSPVNWLKWSHSSNSYPLLRQIYHHFSLGLISARFSPQEFDICMKWSEMPGPWLEVSVE